MRTENQMESSTFWIFNRNLPWLHRLGGLLHLLSALLAFFLCLVLWLITFRVLVWLTGGPFAYYAPVLFQGTASRHFEFAILLVGTWLLGLAHILGPFAYCWAKRKRRQILLGPHAWSIGYWQCSSGALFILLIMYMNG